MGVVNLQKLRLDETHPGMTEARARAHAEAACVCVARHHSSPAVYEVRNQDRPADLPLEWEDPGERMLASWANANEATEAGAVALVLAALERCTGMVAVRRAETRTGADYYVGPPGSGRDDLEHCLRLEISGVDRGAASTIYARVSRIQPSRPGWRGRIQVVPGDSRTG